ncbi:MAG: hypothetical protein AB7N71_09200, partial [Phycisphaerae bacterium]
AMEAALVDPADEALERKTDITGALEQAIAEAGPAPIAGVVLFSDGIVNGGAPLDAGLRFLQAEKIRVFTVGVGQEEEPPNLRIASLTAPEVTSRRDPYEVQIEIATATNDIADEIEIELFATPVNSQDENDKKRIGSKQVALAGTEQASRVTFEVAPEAAGEYVLTAQISEIPGEADLSDNLRTTVVNVRDSQDRVLLVAGSPTYEYRYLARLLERDQNIQLSCWLQSADERAVRDGNEIITELPRTPEEIFKYDAIILMDPFPGDFDSALAATLRRFVTEFQGGILIAAGPHYTSRFLTDDRLQSLVDILPIEPEKSAIAFMQSAGTYQTQSWPIELPSTARSHPLVRLSDDPATNDAIWRALSEGWWHLPVAGTKPLADTLLRVGNSTGSQGRENDPLLVVQTVGIGRTAVLGFDASWRWRATAEPYFNKFWVEMVRFLTTGRKETTNRRGTIVMERDTIRQGEYVKIDVRVLDEDFVPWFEPFVDVQVESAGEPVQTLRFGATPDQPGWFSGRVQFNVAGAAIVKLPLPGNGPEDVVRKTVRVQAEDLELKTLRHDAEAMQSLAAKTGGRYFRLADAHEIPALLHDATVTSVSRDPDPEALWDHSWLLLTLAGLLALEWSLRRAYSLL